MCSPALLADVVRTATYEDYQRRFLRGEA